MSRVFQKLGKLIQANENFLFKCFVLLVLIAIVVPVIGKSISVGLNRFSNSSIFKRTEDFKRNVLLDFYRLESLTPEERSVRLDILRSKLETMKPFIGEIKKAISEAETPKRGNQKSSEIKDRNESEN